MTKNRSSNKKNLRIQKMSLTRWERLNYKNKSKNKNIKLNQDTKLKINSNNKILLIFNKSNHKINKVRLFRYHQKILQNSQHHHKLQQTSRFKTSNQILHLKNYLLQQDKTYHIQHLPSHKLITNQKQVIYQIIKNKKKEIINFI